MLPVITLITAPGSYSSPVGCKYIKVFLQAGGGGGAGGSALGLVYGGGGGAGMNALKYYPPGTYGVTIGFGGAGGVVDDVGSDGTDTIFDTLNVVDISTVKYGLGGDISVPQTGRGPANTTTDGIRLAVIQSQAGDDDTVDFSGSGGFGYLSSGGAGSYTTGASADGGAPRYGGGGGGGCGATGFGSRGENGYVRVIAYF
jgi:hypothetical protein